MDGVIAGGGAQACRIAMTSAVDKLSDDAVTKGAIDTALGDRGIRVNAVAPGVVDREMYR
jgi:3-oxoacyl-[acyl-carrier protein] reductase